MTGKQGRGGGETARRHTISSVRPMQLLSAWFQLSNLSRKARMLLFMR